MPHHFMYADVIQMSLSGFGWVGFELAKDAAHAKTHNRRALILALTLLFALLDIARHLLGLEI